MLLERFSTHGRPGRTGIIQVSEASRAISLSLMLLVRFAAFSIVPLIILLFAYVLIGQTSDGGPIALFVRDHLSFQTFPSSQFASEVDWCAASADLSVCDCCKTHSRRILSLLAASCVASCSCWNSSRCYSITTTRSLSLLPSSLLLLSSPPLSLPNDCSSLVL